MFTGIIRHLGVIKRVTPLGSTEQDGVCVRIQSATLPFKKVKKGDSIAIQGACMTAVRVGKRSFDVHISQESLSRTVGLNQVGSEVNLEMALRMGDRLDGHLVSGHVDGLGKVSYFAPLGESHELRVRVSKELAPLVAYKGSITLNGVSLTINKVKNVRGGAQVSINIIPHTFAETTLKNLKVGDAINVEVDMLARYTAQLLAHRS